MIPHWQKIKAEIQDITRKLPFLDYIAFDCVVLDEGIALIEINTKSTLANIQVHGGVRHSLLGEKYREFGFLVDDEFFK